MKRKSVNSLSTKIVLSIALISLFIMLVIFAVFEKINKEAFYTIEMEKANLIADTIEPLLALDIYLEMHNKIDQLTLQLIENPNILAVRIVKDNKVLSEIKSQEYEKSINDSFVVKKNIFQPNSKKKIGNLILVYSSKHYKELIDSYTQLSVTMLFGFGIVFILFSLYVKHLLSPLRKIAKSLRYYSPDHEIDIPFSEEKNEIGLISTSLNDMQQKISDYSKKQQNINLYLEDKVEEKTREIRKQLYTDTLTGLPNRHSLLSNIILANEGALLIINIDDFKEINDFFGHIAGDNILIKFANRLKNMFTDEQHITLTRLSGDEFALLFTEKPQADDFESLAQKLVYDIEKMVFFHENNELGIRVTTGGTLQMSGALEKADIALKSAKKLRKSFTVYDEKLNIEEQYKDNMEWVKKLKKGIEKDNILPYFQPIFDNATGRCTSCECLMRLVDSNGNVISPFLFLNIAKKSRLYTQLTKFMIEKSCRYFEHINCDFSINLSVEDMLNNDIVDYIKEQIEKYNVAEKIVFEILESEGIDNYENVSGFIDEMKALGCKVAIDDFGSGYSNFEHLMKLNIDYIKIDGTLIKNLDVDINAQTVVETIVDFAQRLGIQTVAEFVHNEAVYEKVKELKIDRSQGFFLAEPQEHVRHC